MKFFNTAGPVNRPNHYKLNPLHRWDLDEILMLIQQEKYFILHAPRQTGKTSSLLALQDYFIEAKKYCALYINVEIGQAARNNIDKGIHAIVSELFNEIESTFPKLKLERNLFDILKESGAENGLGSVLSYLSKAIDKNIILFIDEIDSLIGDTLVSVLRQLRAGYKKRPENFPMSVMLCGVVDIKDYKIHRADGEIITGGSCFNIKAKSLRLGNFSKKDIRKLYLEHTKESGQKFSEEVFELAWDYTAGQPWLVNALAYEVCFEIKENRDRTKEITAQDLEEAKENLILSRATHLDQLADKLKERRVRKVIEPMLAGEFSKGSIDDKQYCLDLGLVRYEDKKLVISNDIYKEVLPRELTNILQTNMASQFSPDWVNPDQSINVEVLISMFQSFWRENSEMWKEQISGYQEAAPHLVFQGF